MVRVIAQSVRLNKHLTLGAAAGTAGGMDWLQIKNWLVAVTSLEKDALHIYAGIAIQLVAARASARGLASPWPVAVVLVAALANEAYDLLYETWPPADRTRQWLMSVHDVLNTLAVPILLFFLARRGWRFGPGLPPDRS